MMVGRPLGSCNRGDDGALAPTCGTGATSFGAGVLKEAHSPPPGDFLPVSSDIFTS
jgi:hypothetical protein